MVRDIMGLMEILSFSYLLMFIYCLINYEASIRETIVKFILAAIGISIIQTLCYFAVSFVDIKWSLTVEQKEMSVSILYFAIILAFSATFFVLFLVLMIWEWQKMRTESEKRKTQLQLNGIYYEAYEGLIQSIRERQHDFKNHLNAIEGMIYSINDYDELVEEQKKYMHSIMGDVETTRLLTLVENPSIAGFLNYKVSRAQEMGITIKYHCVLQKREMKLPEFKLIEMMGILFDNATEELSSDKIENKVLELELVVEDDKMRFSVTNSYDKTKVLDISKIFGKGYSSKGNGRGIGLSKLKHMINDADGEVTASQEIFRIHLC